MGSKKKKKKKDTKSHLDVPSSLDGSESYKPYLVIAALALLLRLVYWAIFRDDFWLRTPLLDDNNFVRMAGVISREGWLAKSLGIFDLNPAYPYFLAFIGKIVGSKPVAVAAFQHAIGVLVPVLFYWFTKTLFDKRTGYVAAALALLYGPFFYYESRLLGAFWIPFFNLMALVSLLWAERGAKPFWGWFLAGLCLGFSAVFRPNLFLFIPAVILWAVWRNHSRKPILGICLLLFFLGLWLPHLPFQIRNKIVAPERGWGLTTSSGGVNFYLGNNPESNGLNAPPSFVRYGPGRQYEDFKEEAERRVGRSLRQDEVSGFWTKEALRWFQQSPKKAWWLVWRKMRYFWNHKEVPDNLFLSQFQKLTDLGSLPLLGWALLAPLGLAGLLLSLFDPRGRRFWVLHLYVLSYFVMVVAFIVLTRYRLPVVVGLIPLASYFVIRIWSFAEKKEGKKVGMAALLLLSTIAFSRMNLIGEEDMAVSHYSMGVVYGNRGHKDKALEEYRLAIKEDPTFKAAYNNLAILSAERGNMSEAKWALENLLQFERDLNKRKSIEDALRQISAIEGT